MIFGAIFIIVFIVCGLQVYLGDDVTYQYIWNAESMHPSPTGAIDWDKWQPIGSYSDLFNSMSLHYQLWNGRYVAHFLVQGFLGLWGQTAFALCNALVWCIFLCILTKVCHGDWRRPASLWSVAIMGFISFSTKMVPSCQIGYIWMFTLALFMLRAFISRRRYNVWQIVGLGVLAVLAGNGNEGLNCGLSVAMVVYLLFNFREIKASQIAILVAFGIGLALLVFAPSTVRVTHDFTAQSSQSFPNFLLYSRSSYVLFFVAIYMICRRKINIPEFCHENILWVTLYVACLAFNFYIGINSTRQLFGVELAALVLTMRMLPHHAFSSFWLICGSALLILFFYLQISYIMVVRDRYKKILSQYSSQTCQNGDVYLDMGALGWWLWQSCYTEDIIWPDHKPNNYPAQTLAIKVRHECPGKPKLRILPEFLKGKEQMDLGNMAVPYADGQFLLIQSKRDPAEFYIQRGMTIFGKTIPRPEIHADLLNPILETPYYRAAIFDMGKRPDTNISVRIE